MSSNNVKLVPAALKAELPLEPKHHQAVLHHRQTISSHLSTPLPSRLLVIIGPCSIHSIPAALEYTRRLASAAHHHRHELLICMRVYIEKPRTTVGWKGLVHDPNLTQSSESDFSSGLYTSRQLMLKVIEMGLTVVTEILSPLIIPFLEDVLALGVIGARTTESQTHREISSDVPFPMGFKNGTDGSVGVAVNAIKAATTQHGYLGVDDEGRLVQKMSKGNEDTFVILRGGTKGTNYDEESVKAAEKEMVKGGTGNKSLVVDCSHGNSNKDYRNQGIVARCVGEQFAKGGKVSGVMIESNISAGRQEIGTDMKYGVSVTDGCVGWEETEKILEDLAQFVKIRQMAQKKMVVDVKEGGHSNSLIETTSPVSPVSPSIKRSVRRDSINYLVEKFRPTISIVEL